MHTFIIQGSNIVYVDPQSFDETGTRICNALDTRTTTANAKAVTVDSLPPDFTPWQWTWDGEKPVIKPECFEEWIGGIKARKQAEIDAETSVAILAGFDYEISGVSYHFSYDAFDQQNFSDTANMCQLALAGTPGLPTSVTWNSYMPDGTLVRHTFDAQSFLTLYVAGAMRHKAAKMAEGGQRKAAVTAAQTAEDVEAA